VAAVAETAVPEFSDRDLRDALGRFATGVTVVTTMTPEGPLGITANSFASLSLDPPLVLWSPARTSSRFAAFEAASHFTVHVLAEDQEALARRFARSGAFDRLAFARGLGEAPLLDGCAARLECRHAARFDGGDHLICVGEVLRLSHEDRAPLVFHRGGYRGLAC
jgi:flavin reductase (DIM6/NTAB) family NADH-FMN oxidoreductase RutF